MTLYDIGAGWAEIEELLMDNGGELTEEIEERLGELMTLESEKVNGYLMVRANLKMMEEGAKAEADRLAKKSRSAANSIKRMEERLRDHMVMKNVSEIKADLGTVRVMEASSQPCELNADIDPRNLPEPYRKVTYAADKAALKAALTGDDPAAKEDAAFFAHLGERTKYVRVF